MDMASLTSSSRTFASNASYDAEDILFGRPTLPITPTPFTLKKRTFPSVEDSPVGAALVTRLRQPGYPWNQRPTGPFGLSVLRLLEVWLFRFLFYRLVISYLINNNMDPSLKASNIFHGSKHLKTKLLKKSIRPTGGPAINTPTHLSIESRLNSKEIFKMPSSLGSVVNAENCHGCAILRQGAPIAMIATVSYRRLTGH